MSTPEGIRDAKKVLATTRDKRLIRIAKAYLATVESNTRETKPSSWSEQLGSKVFFPEDDDTFMIMSTGIAGSCDDRDEPYCLLLEIGGKGGWDVCFEGSLAACVGRYEEKRAFYLANRYR